MGFWKRLKTALSGASETLVEAVTPRSFGEKLWEAAEKRLARNKYSAGQLEITEKFYRVELPDILLPYAHLPATPENFCASFSAFVVHLADSGYFGRFAEASDRAGATECVEILETQARAMGEALSLASREEEELAHGADYDRTVFDTAIAMRVSLHKRPFPKSVRTVADAWLSDKCPVISPDI